jgi:hypothetical protein
VRSPHTCPKIPAQGECRENEVMVEGKLRHVDAAFISLSLKIRQCRGDIFGKYLKIND